MTSLRIILVATVLGVLASAFAEQPTEDVAVLSEEPNAQFKTRVGYRASTGEFVPLVDARLFVGWGQGGCQPSLQTEQKVTILPDGGVVLVARPRIVATLHRSFNPSDDETETSCSETTEWPCYRFRAVGCRDYTLRFDNGEKPSDPIEMKCPGRRVARPRRDG
jgi:hypothetical protein